MESREINLLLLSLALLFFNIKKKYKKYYFAVDEMWNSSGNEDAEYVTARRGLGRKMLSLHE